MGLPIIACIWYNWLKRKLPRRKSRFFVFKEVIFVHTIELKTLLRRTGFLQEIERVFKKYEERINYLEEEISALEAKVANNS